MNIMGKPEFGVVLRGVRRRDRYMRNSSGHLGVSPGFTLTELLVAVAITGVLAMIAYPGYQGSVLKSRRTDGIVAALAVQVAQEKFRANCHFYAQSLGDNNVCGTNAGASAVRASAVSPDGHYAVSILPGSATSTSYTIVATPVGTQMKDVACDPLTVTFSASHPNGLKAPANCW